MYSYLLNKYNLKLSNLIGGSNSSSDPNEILSDWEKIEKTGSIDSKDYTFTIYHKSFNAEEKPILFAMAGFSSKSCAQSAQVIKDRIETLQIKYKSIYIINLNPVKDLQSERFRRQEDNEKILNSIKDLDKRTEEYQEVKNKPELDLTRSLADIINNFIGELDLTNVHLLGKSSGGGVVINLVEKNKRYTGLFLSVPMWPYNITKLKDATLKRVKFRFAWNINDEYPRFDWNDEVTQFSYQEKAVYDQNMANFIKENKNIDYMSIMFHPDLLITRVDYPGHEIHHKLIDFITFL